MSNQKRIKVTVDTTGGYAIEAGEGFSGSSCVEQTRNLELAIGGSMVDEGKTNAFYNGEDDNDVMIKL